MLFYDPTQPAQWRLPLADGRQVRQIEMAISPFSLRQQWQIPRRLSQEQVTLYHSPYHLMPYRPAVPTLLTVYDLIPQHFPRHVSLLARLFFRLTMRLALRAARHIITISESTRRDLLAAYPIEADRVTAVPLAADPHFRPQSETEVARIRAKYQLPASYLLYLGINKPHKNLPHLLRAWRLLLAVAETPPPPLIIAGAWDDRYPEARLMAAAPELATTVRFLGPIAEADLPALYSGALLFIFPTLYEGFGLPVVEAMACGTAVACSDRSSLPEVAGAAARLFDPHDPAAIAAALSDLLYNEPLRAALQAAGLKQARQFTWPATARQTIAIYREFSARE
jgi:glycosyltransferase involved in cell wall biosynthesis